MGSEPGKLNLREVTRREKAGKPTFLHNVSSRQDLFILKLWCMKDYTPV